ncbi:hypothetical protein [Ruficoccus sp. ZRK36]|uniref:NACHT domain-containing protein n=1 Tax=Ruficoccus sp. ZRK36 TaxID=2866311 RepID=UPI001C72F7AF|nr:hypothetical protein [Ruficoccus sp. ZRK36]QYY34996.1 hypothetical protein K0V07_11875 [Ruficoccus sp. ZRK36]
MPTDHKFPWKRFWVRAGGKFSLETQWGDSDGLLYDPEMRYSPNSHLLDTNLLTAPKPGCIVLCGEPGMGKTIAIDDAIASTFTDTSALIYHKFRTIPDAAVFEKRTVESRKWLEWNSGSHLLTMVIDGVDEGLIKIASFVSYLSGLLTDCPVERLQLILACRSLEWPESEGNELSANWTGSEINTELVGKFELCPLRRKDVVVATQAILSQRGEESETDTFFRWAIENRHHGLISRPLTLKMVLDAYQSGVAGSTSRTEFYLGYAKKLCAEIDESRATSLRNLPVERLAVSASIRFRVASRIAALMALCGRSAIAKEAVDEDSNDLLYSEIEQGGEVCEGTRFPLSRTQLESTLETPLFWLADDLRAHFYHMSFLECLASDYLKKLPVAQLKTLLTDGDDYGAYVHPQLAEVTGWLALQNKEFFDFILANDPEALLRVDMQHTDASYRSALVDAVLAKAGKERLFDRAGYGRFLHTLNHEGLSEQLRPWIVDKSQNLIVRRIALEIAEKCHLASLFEVVFKQLQDTSDQLTNFLDSSISYLATSEHSEQIECYVREEFESMTSHTLFCLIRQLLKSGHWRIADSLPYLEKVCSQSSADYILSQYIESNDVLPLLREAVLWGNCFDFQNDMECLVTHAVSVALEQRKDPAVIDALAKLWVHATRYHATLHSSRDEENGDGFSKIISADSVFRRSMVHQSILYMKDQDDEEMRVWYFYDICLLEDFSFLLDQIAITRGRTQSIYIEIANRTYRPEVHHVSIDKMLELAKVYVDFSNAFRWYLRPIELESEEAGKHRDSYYERLKRDRDIAERRQKRDLKPIEEVWDEAISFLDRDDPRWWIRSCERLFYRETDNSLRIADRGHDFTTSSGWAYLDPTSRQRFIAGARRLILEASGVEEHKYGSHYVYNSWAYSALYYFRHEILRDSDLADAVTKKWIPAMLDHFSNGDDHHLEMVALAYSLAPHVVCEWLDAVLSTSLASENTYVLELRELKLIWNESISERIYNIVCNSDLSANAAYSLIEMTYDYDESLALRIWKHCSTLTDTSICSMANAAFCSKGLFKYWDELWPLLESDHALAESCFYKFEYHERKSLYQNCEIDRERKIADFYLLFRQVFPKSEDPEFESGTVPPRVSVARLRDDIPSILVSFSTVEAIKELERLANSVPEEERIWMRWKLHEAIDANRRKEWKPPTAEFVLDLVSDTHKRWLRNESDLMSLAIESLVRLEDNLQRSSNSPKHDYWLKRKGDDGVDYWKPDRETALARRIANWLEIDLPKALGITIQVEVQLQIDERTDIEVKAVGIGNNEMRPLELTIEVKGCWHSEVTIAHKTQLVDRYLKNSGRTHGIYLVVWTLCDRWNDSRGSDACRMASKTLDEARAELKRQTSEITMPHVIAPFLLDATI